jgi:hypothetical protein
MSWQRAGDEKYRDPACQQNKKDNPGKDVNHNRTPLPIGRLKD